MAQERNHCWDGRKVRQDFKEKVTYDRQFRVDLMLKKRKGTLGKLAALQRQPRQLGALGVIGHGQNMPLKERHEEGLEREAETKLRRDLDFI